jgi:hypothetical protein
MIETTNSQDNRVPVQVLLPGSRPIFNSEKVRQQKSRQVLLFRGATSAIFSDW